MKLIDEKNEFKQTPLYKKHLEIGAKIIEFSGWLMPLNYSQGIMREHLITRKNVGIFDISHMGRFKIFGKNSLVFLQHVLTNNAASLEVGDSQYTIISDNNGIAIDDAYLYKFYSDSYILVVNAVNTKKDFDYLIDIANNFKDIYIKDITDKISMLSIQGPKSKEVLISLISSGNLPEPLRNKLSIINIDNNEVLVARTGYTGEPLGFELFIESDKVVDLWDKLMSKGASPVGLGARDTLRLEATLPLYGHELGINNDNIKIPIFSSPQSRIAVSFAEFKNNFIGKDALMLQFNALKKILNKNYSQINILPKIIMPLELLDKGIARSGDKVYFNNNLAGFITSGTIAPYWIFKDSENSVEITESSSIRSIALALIDSRINEQDIVSIDIRGKKIEAIVMPYFIRSEASAYAYPITAIDILKKKTTTKKNNFHNSLDKVNILIEKCFENSLWRQKQCINLIPSEMTPSRIVKLLSVADPAGRYAEHKKLKAFKDAEVFYYQGTEFISKIEELLKIEFKKYLGCNQVETRVISGQMANTVVFSAIVDFLNRLDRKSEPKRISSILNHHIIKGGHLSSQPMGALKDFVMINPVTEKPAVIDFPVFSDNPYKTDVEETKKIITKYKPELIIFGKSLMIYKEPILEIKNFIDSMGFECIIMYDMAHVLGLLGPWFQEPFTEGVDIVTGSTHKTFFGTQRGIIGSNWVEPELKYKLWETIESRTFPGAVSNHHLGTMLGLLAATYEMNYFKDSYQTMVLSNAKAFAEALASLGLNVAGDKIDGYTQTHQVILNVGYGKGPEIAEKLEKNNIITNYQATPLDEGFTTSSAIRMGTAEMTRFGMKPDDFAILAEFISEIIKNDRNVKEEIKKFRANFLEMKYCFDQKISETLIEKLYKCI